MKKGEFVKKALLEREEDAKEAVSASSGAMGFVGSLVRGMFATPRKPSPASRWLEEDSEKKQYEIQLRREQEEERQRRKEQKEEEERERAWAEYLATQPPGSRAPSEKSERRGRSSRRRGQTATRVQSATTPRRSRSKKSPPDMGESSERERMRQAVFRQALAV